MLFHNMENFAAQFCSAKPRLRLCKCSNPVCGVRKACNIRKFYLFSRIGVPTERAKVQSQGIV